MIDLNIPEFNKTFLIIAAAETEDEIGTVLRLHLAIEQILVWYISFRKNDSELKQYVKEPRDFGGKLALAAAFGLPIPLVRVVHQINVIRNKLAHQENSLSLDQMQELERQVNKLAEMDTSFRPLRERYVELKVKRPGEKIRYGSGDARLDFFMAAMALYGVAMKWAAIQTGAAK